MRTFAGIRLVVTFAVMAAASEAIRIYEGTNLGPGQTRERKSPQSHLRAESRSDVRSEQLLKFSKELKPTPNLYKVKLTQQGYLQFLRYLADIPPLREYTFCLWFMSKNLSHPHPLFSYSMQDKARLLSVWYEPMDATVRMTVRDDLMFKVPALIREGQWHHVCQSWNGVFGEWAVFFDGTKIGSGKLQKYKGTYVPGGGEVVVGQEPTDFHKGLDDGIEGEVFGFNLVDEAVKDEAIVAKHPPISDPVPQPTQYIPPFKALPPMKKSYHEIKTFIKSLPPPSPYGTRNGPKTAPGGHPPPKPHHKGKPSKRPGRPTRGKNRPHYKPVKAIVYEREDRKLRLDESALTKKLGTPAEEEEEGSNQTRFQDENYSIHSYKPPKERSRTVGYEIREAAEEADEKSGQRKARLSFDLHTARKANSLYEKANRERQQKKQSFHFEVAKEKQLEGIRRSLNVEKSEGRPRDAIPVHEVVEEDSARRKRDLSGDDLSVGFRPMPRMPDGFIDQFGQGNVTTPERPREADKRNDVFDAPGAGQHRRNMVVSVRELQRRPGPTSGSELVKRSYEECAADRGSPLRDKDRLVVSWAETPVRIYGGAVVTTALGLCGHF